MSNLKTLWANWQTPPALKFYAVALLLFAIHLFVPPGYFVSLLYLPLVLCGVLYVNDPWLCLFCIILNWAQILTPFAEPAVNWIVLVVNRLMITVAIGAVTLLARRMQNTDERLRQTNADLEQFAYITSHDLKAPLRAVNNLATWIEEDIQEIAPPTTKKNLDLLRKRINRMDNLIDGVLQYSRIGRSQMRNEAVDTKLLVHEILEHMDKKQFTIQVADDLPRITGNRTCIVQLFSNLLSNAIKHHTRDDGRIEVRVQNLRGQYEFTIVDDGPGIEPQYHAKIFQIFQTLRPRDEFESTGVGLTLVKRIIEEAGGTIRVESSLGNGSKFIFTWAKS